MDENKAHTYAAQLTEVHHQIRGLEGRHNEMLDQFAFIGEDATCMKDELHTTIGQLRAQLIGLHEEVRLREERLRKVSLLLSLIATKDEVRPLSQRIDIQKYEQYVTKEWFEAELHKVLRN